MLLCFQWLDQHAEEPDLLCVVIFRGSWCKYDKYYLRRLGHFLKSKMEQNSISLVAWTSEGEAGAKKADEEWSLTKDFGYKEVIGDDTNALAKYLVEDEILPALVTKTPEEAKVKDLVSAGSHSNGIVMPAVLWYAHHGSAPVFEWAHECKAPGLGGPDRPEPSDMWEQVVKRKHALDHGDAVMPSHGTNIRMCTNDFDVMVAGCSVL